MVTSASSHRVVLRLAIGALLVSVSSCGLDESGQASANGGADAGGVGGSGGIVGGTGGASGGVGGTSSGGGGAAGATGGSAGAGGATGGSAGAGATGGTAGAGGATGGTAGAGGVAGAASGGTGGTVVQPPCHPVGLVDTFEGNALSGLWNTQGAASTISVSGGQLHITPNPTNAQWAGLVTATTYNFDECAVWVRVPVLFSNATSGYTYFQLVGAAGIAFEARNGKLEMKHAGNQAEVPYDPQAHKWWRIRETGSTVYFETSADGAAWTVRHSVPSPADITTMKVGLGLVPGTTPSAPLETQFDDLDAP